MSLVFVIPLTTVSKGIALYTDNMNSATVSVSHLLRPGIVVNFIKEEEENGDNRGGLFGTVSDRWHGRENAREENASSSSQLATYRFNLVHSADLTVSQGDGKA